MEGMSDSLEQTVIEQEIKKPSPKTKLLMYIGAGSLSSSILSGIIAAGLYAYSAVFPEEQLSDIYTNAANTLCPASIALLAIFGATIWYSKKYESNIQK